MRERSLQRLRKSRFVVLVFPHKLNTQLFKKPLINVFIVGGFFSSLRISLTEPLVFRVCCLLLGYTLKERLQECKSYSNVSVKNVRLVIVAGGNRLSIINCN